MSRTILAIMAGLLCALAGMKHAASLKSDAVRISRWVSLLEHLTLLLRQGTLSIPEVLCAAADGSQAPDQLLRNMAAALNNTPLLSLSGAFQSCSTSWQEKDILARLFSRLGHGSQASRCLAAEQAASELRLLADTASSRAEKDARLWQTLGAAAGACLTIMLI